MSAKPLPEEQPPHVDLIEGIDYTVENGCWVFTADYLRRRGYCCENGCRNCPYREGSKVGDHRA